MTTIIRDHCFFCQDPFPGKHKRQCCGFSQTFDFRLMKMYLYLPSERIGLTYSTNILQNEHGEGYVASSRGEIVLFTFSDVKQYQHFEELLREKTIQTPTLECLTKMLEKSKKMMAFL